MSSKQNRPPSSEQQRRKYTTRACEQCRRRRAKCDGARPACSRCVSRGQPCQYPEGEDGRKPASKAYVDLLRRRIQALEQILRDHSIDIDASLAALSSSYADFADAGSLTTYREPDPGDADVEALCVAFEGALSIDEALNYEDDGEFRYFGPTSGRQHFLSDTLPEESQDHSMPPQATNPASISINLRNQMNQRLLANNERGPLVSEELKSELTELYFTWQNPWLLVVDEKLYRQSLVTAARYWSPLLENCILAMGCRFTDNPEVRTDPENTNSAGRLFFNRAEIYLSYELKYPSITTVQSLFLLSMLSVSTGADATSWLRQGMAKQLSLDLGINLDTEKMSGSNMIPAEEIELRRLLYWSMYCDDKLAAAYTGRVCTLLDFQGLVAWPSVPIPEADTLAVPAEARRPRMLILLVHALIRISRILEDIMIYLYMPKPRCQGNLRWAFFDSCCLKLKTWTYDLPPELRFDRLGDSSLPQAFTLHMVYSTACILLARPFLATAGATANSVTESTSAVNTMVEEKKYQRVQELLHNSAKQICSTARKYRRVFGSFRRSPITATHCTLSAALVFLQNARSHSITSKTHMLASSSNTEDIKLCLTVLDELSTSWDTARRIRLNLLKLIMKSPVAGIDVGNHSPQVSKSSTRHYIGGEDHGVDPVNLQAPGSSLVGTGSKSQQDFQYHIWEDQIQSAEGQQTLGAMSAAVGFGLEQTLETMIGDEFAFGADIMNDDSEWDAFFQE